MKHKDKIDWMILWAHKNKCILELEGECGIGRECVGILAGNSYPDYSDEVWVPEDAYHKHDCVAVLGRGESAESQLYQWLKWFEDNGYTVEETLRDISNMDRIELILGGTTQSRMIKKAAA